MTEEHSRETMGGGACNARVGVSARNSRIPPSLLAQMNAGWRPTLNTSGRSSI